MKRAQQPTPKVVAGLGARTTTVGSHVLVGAVPSRQPWAPSWNIALTTAQGQTAVYVGRGLVNGVEPVVDGLPISGKENPTKQGVEFRRPSIVMPVTGDAEGRAWLCLQVEVNEQGIIADPKKVTVVATGELPGLAGDAVVTTPGVAVGLTGWHPLAVLRNGVELHSICHFDLNHRAVKDSRGRWRHFFWAA
jgi:hypothetical protein